MIRSILFVLIITILSGCRSDSFTSGEVIPLAGERIFIPEDFLGKGLDVIASDTFYFQSYDPAYKYVVARLKNDTLFTCDSILKMGQGPGEVLSASLFKDRNDQVYALTKSTNHPISVKEIDLYSDSRNWTEVSNDTLRGNFDWGGRNNIVLTPDSMVLFAGAKFPQVKGMLSLFNMRDGTVENTDFFPADGIKSSPLTKYAIYTINSLLGSNNKGQYVYGMGFNKFAFIFHLENDTPVIDKWLFDEYPNYNQTDELGNYHYDPQKERLFIYATDSYIYILIKNLDQNGKRAESFSDVSNGDNVLVFDWKGNKMASYELDSFGSDIFIDKADDTLYLEKDDGDTGELILRKYSLPKD